MEAFLLFYLFFNWVLHIIYKVTDLDKPDSWLRNNTIDFKYSFLYNLMSCQLCVESHVGALISAVLYLVSNDINMALYGYMAAGLSATIRQFLNR